VDDDVDVTPSERACLTAVVRFRALLHARVSPRDSELDHLRRFLAADAPDAFHAADDKRRWRRFDTKIRASARLHGMTSDCTVLDVGAGGLRVKNDSRLTVRAGDKLVVCIEGGAAALRIDLPVQIKHVEDGGVAFGVEFLGAPLVLHQRATSRKAPRNARARTSETPMARDDSTAADLAA
jgi:hypothetical protein